MALVKCVYHPAEYKARDDIKLEISDLTRGNISKNSDNEFIWTGSEILDVLLNVLGDNLKIQYDNGRITGNDYSQAYTKMIEVSVAQAMHFLELQRNLILKDKEIENQVNLANSKNELDACLQNNKLALEEKKVDSDIAVANRQIAGYDDNLVIKLLQCELDAFALIYSSGMLDNPDLGPLRSSLLTLCWQMLFNRIPESQAAWKEHERVYGNG